MTGATGPGRTGPAGTADPASSDVGAVLDREARSLVRRLRLWTPQRWSAAAEGGGSRADLALHLARALAAASGAPATLPRLDNDLALPDQLAVAAHDLVLTGPDRATAVAATAHLLLHRSDLLGDDVPPGLAAALGLGDVLATARAGCPLHP